MAGVRRARQETLRETRREIDDFLRIGAVQVAELDLGDGTGTADEEAEEAVLRPGPGSPPVTPGAVFVLVRRAGLPVGTLLGQVPEGADPTRVLARLARELPRGAPPEPWPAPPSAGVVVATRGGGGRRARAGGSRLALVHL
ncbi:glycosyltransferase family 2 protein, partial [Streptomyces sp. NPDC057074]